MLCGYDRMQPGYFFTTSYYASKFQPIMAGSHLSKISWSTTMKKHKTQESPAWTQEAYRPLCRKCSGWGGPTLGYPFPMSWPGGTHLSWLKGYLPWGTPPPHPDLAGGTYLEVPPVLTWLGGTYLGRWGGYLPWGTSFPSPPNWCEQTDTCENSIFPSYYVRGR